MSTATSSLFEFRCTSCFQSLLADTETVGSSLECRWCGNSVQIPEPTEDGIERGRAYAEGSQTLEGSELVAVEPARTSEERIQLAKRLADERAKTSNARCTNPSQRSASRISRLVAYLIDSFVIGLIGSITLIVALAVYGVARNEFVLRVAGLPIGFWVIAYSMPAAYTLACWITISLYGKTLGKYLMKTKIVDANGDAPGFLQGVIIRNIIWNITTTVPSIPILHQAGLWPSELAFTGHFLFNLACTGCVVLALANIFAIFLEPPRCLHDRLAGTYVIGD